MTEIPRIDALLADPGLKRLRRALLLTRLGLAAERATRAFWPLWTLVLACAAALSFGIAGVIPADWFWLPVVLVVLAALAFLILGLRRFAVPSRADAMERLDATLPGRPLTALTDEPAWAGDPATAAVWRAHLARMADRAARARAPQPDLRVADRDPFGLRFLAATAFAMALLFGAIWRVADVSEAVASAPLPGQPGGGPAWEGWVEPPLYTGLPSIYLNDLLRNDFSAPEGSQITLRFYGELGEITVDETVSGTPVVADDTALAVRRFELRRPGILRIDGPGGRGFAIEILPDIAPTVALASQPEGVPPGQMQFEFAATDDYRVVAGTATIALNPGAVDRRHGLSVAPEPREALVLDLPMPFSGARDDFTEVFADDLAAHPFANLPVVLELAAVDDLGQQGIAREEVARLPGRRFFDPLAGAIAEQRRDLLWSRENRARAARMLRAVSYLPDGSDDAFPVPEARRQVRTAITALETAGPDLTTEARDEVADLLWQAALTIEDYRPEDAQERLTQAQDRLAEAMRQGASDREISELMQEMREAMDQYMQELAQNARPRDGTDEPDNGDRQGTEMTQGDIDEMMRRIEELMREGRMAEAMEMLEALRQMMENMEVVEGDGSGDGPRTPGEQAMEGLQDTLRGQQELSDESFGELQDRSGQPGGDARNQPGQQGGGPDGDEGAPSDQGSLAERQEQLRRELERQRDRLPGGGTEDGAEARRQLDEAGRAMDRAADALERGDLPGALDEQADAMDALREGMQALGRALAREPGEPQEGPAQGQADGTMEARDRPLTDPLGRAAGNAGTLSTEQGIEEQEEAGRRARELMAEILRRSGDLERPEPERDYLRRLLDWF